MTFVDILWTIAGFILTLFVLSYIFGDNPLSRFALYLLIGVSAGYLLVVVFQKVLVPRLFTPLVSGTVLQRVLVLVPILLGTLLLFKLSSKLGRFGNIPMAYLVGAGTAVLIGGAIFGTLLPQTGATITAFHIVAGNPSELILKLGGALFLLIGTVSTLAYFQFWVKSKSPDQPKKPGMGNVLGKIGQIFIAITLGALFAGVILATLTALLERLSSLWSTISLFLH